MLCCEVGGSQSSVAEESSLLVWYTMCLVSSVQHFEGLQYEGTIIL